MRVDILTLTTASAAALTIGLASPALAASNTDAQAGLHQRAQHVAVHPWAQSLTPESAHGLNLVRRDGDGDDDDDDDDGDGGGGGDDDHHRFRHRHHRGIAPFAFGDEGCDGESCGGDGDHAAGEEEGGGCCAGGGGAGREVVKKVRGRTVRMPGQVSAVPSGAVRTGFGGAQGSSVPLGVAGLTLILGGAGLLARRRIRTGARS
jgi:hypothetical protein